MTEQRWRQRVLEAHPTAQFTKEDGTGKTYGDVGDWVAHVGPDMQADVVGVYTKEYAWYTDADGNEVDA